MGLGSWHHFFIALENTACMSYWIQQFVGSVSTSNPSQSGYFIHVRFNFNLASLINIRTFNFYYIVAGIFCTPSNHLIKLRPVCYKYSHSFVSSAQESLRNSRRRVKPRHIFMNCGMYVSRPLGMISFSRFSNSSFPFKLNRPRRIWSI